MQMRLPWAGVFWAERYFLKLGKKCNYLSFITSHQYLLGLSLYFLGKPNKIVNMKIITPPLSLSTYAAIHWFK